MPSGSGATDPLRPWRCCGVSGAAAPESLTDVSSSGFARLLPCRNTNDFEDFLYPWRYGGVSGAAAPESCIGVSDSGLNELPAYL
ncbi:hypothetical protein [Yersinia bercovieri]|uniref:hypothetical protein n=1 Tax=Yersinia bercovieri TaxID=634 RepID=UPI0016438E1E|nr:hypothetical protein [Yersinia bercovieri]